jgi:BASS family bile acid:Na+ symporter
MTAHDLFNAIFNASLSVMILALVASLGIGLTIRQLVEPLSSVGVLAGTVIVNSLLAPLIAIGICDLFPMNSEARTGVELATIAAAGPVGLKSAQLAKRADLAMAVSFLIVLQLVNIVAAPLWAKQMISGATVDLWTILKDLLLLVLAPLAIGLFLRARYPEHADGWRAGLDKTSNIALIAVIAFGLAANWQVVVHSLGSWILVASAMIVSVYIALGWIVGRLRDTQAAVTISCVSSFRFTPIGLVVIAAVLNNQGAYLIPALLFSLVDTFIPLAAGVEFGRAAGKAEKKGTLATAPAVTPVGAAR